MLNRIKHNSNGKQKRLQELVWSIRSKLEELGNESHGSRLLIQKINNEGKTILVVTHEDDIAKMCKRIVKLKDGVIVEDKKIKQVIVKQNV